MCCACASILVGRGRRASQGRKSNQLFLKHARGIDAGCESLSQDLWHYPLDDPGATLAALGETVAASTGGTSGALYEIMLTAAGAALRSSAFCAKKSCQRTHTVAGRRCMRMKTICAWCSMHCRPDTRSASEV